MTETKGLERFHLPGRLEGHARAPCCERDGETRRPPRADRRARLREGRTPRGAGLPRLRVSLIGPCGTPAVHCPLPRRGGFSVRRDRGQPGRCRKHPHGKARPE